jgi:RNA polymerase sigma-70 factor (ECF subfamily)
MAIPVAEHATMRIDTADVRSASTFDPLVPRAARQQDDDSFVRLYCACYPELVDFCRRRLPGRADPEAVAQEAFIRAWTTPDRFSGTRLRGLLYTIARRLCIDVTRRVAMEEERVDLASTTANRPAQAVDEVVERHYDDAVARTVLAGLAPEYRRILHLRYLNGWSYAQIAQVDDRTVEGVRSALRRARSAFRRAHAAFVSTGHGWAVARWYRRLLSRPGSRGRPPELALAPWLHLCRAPELLAGLVVVLTTTVVAPSPTDVTAPVFDNRIGVPAPAGPTFVPSPLGTRTGSRPQTVVQRPPDPDAGGGSSALPVVVPLLHAGTTEDTSFHDFTPSPQYQADGTVFATGFARRCVYGTCAAVFRSTDHGASWERLAALGFTGGSLHLPPTYPSDRRIFAMAGAGALMVSHDDGRSFAPVLGPPVQTGTRAQMSPTFADDGWILLGASNLEYRDRVGAMVPTDSLGHVGFVSPTFSPGFGTDGTIFDARVQSTDFEPAQVLRCVRGACSVVARLLRRALPAIVVSPRYAGQGRVAAFSGDELYLSVSGAGDYRPPAAAVPLDGEITDAAFDRRERLFVASSTPGAYRPRGGLAVSDDDGRSWRLLGEGTPLATGVSAVEVLPDGRILASVPRAGRSSGVWCSIDDGATWHARCPA